MRASGLNTLFICLFVGALGGRTWAASSPAVSGASAASAIERAQTLTLEKNRHEAVHVLDEALQATTPGSKNRIRLLEVLNNVAKTFFTDKGQQLYESAQTEMFENPDIALTRYRQALAIEDGNVLVLNGIAHSQLAKTDCAGALQTAETARAQSSYLSEPALLELRGLICLGKYEEFRDKLKALPTMEKSQDYFVQFLTAQDFIQQKMWKRAGELLLRVTEAQPRFPEAYYLLHKMHAEMDDQESTFAQKYISLCKAMTVRDRKRYALEPRLCSAVKEVEDEMAKKSRES
jgi:tetratricopeptide (TPR) repeat protein